jgi:hypothetical protein
MAADYGTIVVFLQPNLADEQTFVIVKNNVENQLMSKNRNHFNEILHQCTEMVKLVHGNNPFTVHWNMIEYKYTFKVEFVEVTGTTF